MATEFIRVETVWASYFGVHVPSSNVLDLLLLESRYITWTAPFPTTGEANLVTGNVGVGLKTPCCRQRKLSAFTVKAQ